MRECNQMVNGRGGYKVQWIKILYIVFPFETTLQKPK